jgi:hypothetical protein
LEDSNSNKKLLEASKNITAYRGFFEMIGM